MIDIKVDFIYPCYWLHKIGRKLHELKFSWEILGSKITQKNYLKEYLADASIISQKTTVEFAGDCHSSNHIYLHMQKSLLAWKKIAFLPTNGYLAKSIKY